MISSRGVLAAGWLYCSRGLYWHILTPQVVCPNFESSKVSARILLATNELDLAKELGHVLDLDGRSLDIAKDGEGAMALALSSAYDLLILEMKLPVTSGLNVCRDLRQQGFDIPIILLATERGPRDRVLALKLGADDCLTKPFDLSELTARVEAILRRYRVPLQRYRFGEVKVDFGSATILRAGAPVTLPAKQLELLRILIDHRGRALTREDLLERVWKYCPGVSSRTVDVHIAALRQKLEITPSLHDTS